VRKNALRKQLFWGRESKDCLLAHPILNLARQPVICAWIALAFAPAALCELLKKKKLGWEPLKLIPIPVWPGREMSVRSAIRAVHFTIVLFNWRITKDQ
jgi:hypothetical protein